MGNDTTVKDNSITYHFSKNVKQKSQKAIQDIFSEIRDKSTKNKEFFDNFTFNVCGQWKETEETKGEFYTTKGFTNYDNNNKEIYLKTNKIVFNRPINTDDLRQTVAHEVGHVFNQYFSDFDKETIERIRELQVLKNNDSEYKKEYDILVENYLSHALMSDSNEFKTAWKKDIEVAYLGHSRIKQWFLTRRLGYFSPSSFQTIKDGCRITINPRDGIDDKELNYSYKARDEIFAELFSCAMGTHTDNKKTKLIINTYKHSYEVVKNLINEYLGTNTKGHYIPRDNSLNREF